jgi:hypothetical protein
MSYNVTCGLAGDGMFMPWLLVISVIVPRWKQQAGKDAHEKLPCNRHETLAVMANRGVAMASLPLLGIGATFVGTAVLVFRMVTARVHIFNRTRIA